MNLKHKQCSNTIAAINQDYKKNNHAQGTRSYPGKTLLKQGKNPTTLYYIAKRRTPLHRKYRCQQMWLSRQNSSTHKRVLYDQES
jgi:hypothetical protein